MAMDVEMEVPASDLERVLLGVSRLGKLRWELVYTHQAGAGERAKLELINGTLAEINDQIEEALRG